MAVVSSRFETFGRDIKIATEGLSAEAISKELAQAAKAGLREVIASGQASARYTRFVNGRKGAPEDSVVAPGPIIYVFSYWPEVITAALQELRKRVPVKTGRYAHGFMVLANGRPVVQYTEIDPDDEVVIFNVQPYTRKMESGGNRTGRKHFDRAAGALRRQFRDVVTVRDTFLKIEPGLVPGVPYILRGQGLIPTSGGRFRKAGGGFANKNDHPGMPITYPALVMNQAE